MPLSACTTGGSLTTALESAAEPDPALPDPQLPEEVDVVPTPRVATALASAGALPEIRPAGYSGPTPSGAATVFAPEGRFGPETVAARSPELDALIARYAQHYEVPEALVRRVVKRESIFNPAARNGPYWGLMQIRQDTARGMGYDGPAAGLLDAETNLKYAVRYLRGAYMTAGGNHDQAVRLYARGYYYDAKAKGLLEETGLRGPRRRMPEIAAAAPAAAPEQAMGEPVAEAAAEPPVAAAEAGTARRAILSVAPPSEPHN